MNDPKLNKTYEKISHDTEYITYNIMYKFKLGRSYKRFTICQ